MTTKERSIFLVEKYGEDSISVVESVLENNEDQQEKKYWTDVKNQCLILIKDKKQTDA
jgi:hypothetical protein